MFPVTTLSHGSCLAFQDEWYKFKNQMMTRNTFLAA